MISILRYFSIQFRFGVLVVLVCAGFMGITWVSYTTIEHKMMEGKKAALQNVVDAGQHLVAHYYDRFRSGEFSEAEAQQAALESLRFLRYGANGGEYIWVNDMGLTMLMHPLNPKLENTSVADLSDPNGKFLFREMKQLVSNQGSGFVGYFWPREKNGKPIRKLSFVTQFKPWHWIIGSGIYIEDVQQERNALMGKLAAILGVLLLVLIGIIFLLIQSITKPLKQTLHRMGEIASGDGDLTVHLTADGNDELASLSLRFNQFVDKIRDLIVNVDQSVKQLLDSVNGLSQATDHTARSIQSQQSETELVATAMNEMSSAASEIARNADQASTHAHEASREAAGSLDIVLQTSREVTALAGNMETSARAISLLKQETQNIDNVLNVIQGIAEQTNLLALNAAIEAARAGEQGRGFAVVADEVRALASKTQVSTKEINDMIQRLQQGASEAVAAMEDSVEKSQATVAATQKAEGALNTVTNAIQTINAMNAQVAVASEEQSSVSEEINRNVTNIAQLTVDCNEATEEVVNITQQVRQVGELLNRQVSEFKIR
ncbi:MAG: methyl-accepting chemotaxis protein [Pseudomonadota bacterium]|nr:methyl-accepting chemotaxis protein [Pseudomonadota bacterium]